MSLPNLLRRLAPAAALLALSLVAESALAQGKKKKEEPPPLPPPAARIWVVAPAAKGNWTLRIDNESAASLRIPADARLLRLELSVPPPDAKKKQKPKVVKCKLPAALAPDGFPEERTLLLAPGESYTETFDPRLFCFGKDEAALAGGTLVRAHFGWDLPKKGDKKPPKPPFAAELVEDPATTTAQRGLPAPTLLLSFAEANEKGEVERHEEPGLRAIPAEAPPADKPASDKPAADTPAVDPSAPRFELAAEALSDAGSRRSATVSVSAKNVGQRSALAALRGRMLSFVVDGPDGRFECPEEGGNHAIPRDLFRKVAAGDKVTLTVMLAEICAPGTFERPGLYRVTPTLHATADGAQYDLAAWTGDISAPKPTLVRIQSGDLPYHKAPAKASKTGSLEPKLEEVSREQAP